MKTLSLWLLKCYKCGTLNILPIELIRYINEFLIENSNIIHLCYKNSIELLPQIKKEIKNNFEIDNSTEAFGILHYHLQTNKIIHLFKNYLAICDINSNNFVINHKLTNKLHLYPSCVNLNSKLIIKDNLNVYELDLEEYTFKCIRKFVHGSLGVNKWNNICINKDNIYILCRNKIILNNEVIYENPKINLSSIYNFDQGKNLLILGDVNGNILIFDYVLKEIKCKLKCANDAIIGLDCINNKLIFITNLKFIGIATITNNGMLIDSILIVSCNNKFNNVQIISSNCFMVSSCEGKLSFYNFKGSLLKVIKDFYYCRYFKNLNMFACLNKEKINLYELRFGSGSIFN
jgi:hypothetical protein